MLFTHCQKRDFGAKKCSVLSKILIGFSENPLEPDKIGGDSWTQIFTAFSMQRGAESLENTAFSGLSHLPLSSVKFCQVRFWQLDSKCVCPHGHVSSNLSISAKQSTVVHDTMGYRTFLFFCRRNPHWKTAKSIRDAKQDYIFRHIKSGHTIVYIRKIGEKY